MNNNQLEVVEELNLICNRLQQILKSNKAPKMSFMFVADLGEKSFNQIACCNTLSTTKTSEMLDFLQIYALKQAEVGRWNGVLNLPTFKVQCVDSVKHQHYEQDWVETGAIYTVQKIHQSINCLVFEIVDEDGVTIQPPFGFKGFASTRFIPLSSWN